MRGRVSKLRWITPKGECMYASKNDIVVVHLIKDCTLKVLNGRKGSADEIFSFKFNVKAIQNENSLRSSLSTLFRVIKNKNSNV